MSATPETQAPRLKGVAGEGSFASAVQANPAPVHPADAANGVTGIRVFATQTAEGRAELLGVLASLGAGKTREQRRQERLNEVNQRLAFFEGLPAKFQDQYPRAIADLRFERAELLSADREIAA